ncbi:MAG: hypothetical protein OXI24_02965, partial [Candidatus Poribacteria bacterium]|nr:hypothetical protein [Candidatus Poribacteria bacterium]
MNSCRLSVISCQLRGFPVIIHHLLAYTEWWQTFTNCSFPKPDNRRLKTLISQGLLIMLFLPLAVSAHFEEVHVLIEAGEYTQALHKLEALVESNKDIAVKSWCYYQIGEIYYNYTHQYNHAAAAYDKILQFENKGQFVGHPVEVYAGVDGYSM